MAANFLEEFRKNCLDFHNEYRNLHVNTPAMQRDDTLDRNAQLSAEYYSKKGSIDHTSVFKGAAGENLYIWPGNISASKLAEEAVKFYYSEKGKYDYANARYDTSTGHFSQLVWVNSRKLGSGCVFVNNTHYVVNLYDPTGNWPDEFEKNVQIQK